MKRWMNLFFLLWGTACTITATTEDGTYFSSVENVSVATFENVPSDCYISVDKHNYRPYVAVCRIAGWFMYKTGRLLPRIPLRAKRLWPERR